MKMLYDFWRRYWNSGYNRNMKKLTTGVILGVLSFSIQASDPKTLTYGAGDGYVWAHNCESLDDNTTIYIHESLKSSQDYINNEKENKNGDNERCKVVVIKNIGVEETDHSHSGVDFAVEKKHKDYTKDILDFLLPLFL
ncbi:hypothetical protein BPLS_P0204 [Bathymodiolus platifrons methanotrophic gill symbiont]|nr:hypothetical protein BPLS_P0204 [Bathymodiolus platifrons methanotrophic gill symbiont]